METPAKYQVDRPMTRKQVTSRFGGSRFEWEASHSKADPYEDLHPKADVLQSAYFHRVASTADSMIMAGWGKNLVYEELIEEAIAFTDRLIERVELRS